MIDLSTILISIRGFLCVMSKHCSYCFKNLSSPPGRSSTNKGMSNSNRLFDTIYFRMDPLNNIS